MDISIAAAGGRCVRRCRRRHAALGRLTWTLLLAAMVGLGAVGIVAPIVLELLALRRLTASAFGTLMSVEPAVALLMGLLILHRQPGCYRPRASCS